MFFVYCHENPKNGKKYIGITSQEPKARWLNGEGYRANKKFYRDIKKYGWGYFIHTILEKDLTQDEAVQKEAELIWKYDCIENGYNISPGGHYGKAGFLSPNCTIIKNATKKYSFFEFWHEIFESANSSPKLADNLNQYVDAIIQKLNQVHHTEIDLQDEVMVSEVLYELQFICEIIKAQENGTEIPKYKPMCQKVHELIYGGG